MAVPKTRILITSSGLPPFGGGPGRHSFNSVGTRIRKNVNLGSIFTKNLLRRIDDWEKMTANPSFKHSDGTYHKPGSNKK